MYFATTKSIHLEIQLWDCTTHHFEFHKHLRQAYFRNSSAAILIFDISKPKWKDEAHSWISEAYDNQCYLVYAVATKLDLITNPRASKKGLQ
jgi:GTPase SAR1 family protein